MIPSMTIPTTMVVRSTWGRCGDKPRCSIAVLLVMSGTAHPRWAQCGTPARSRSGATRQQDERYWWAYGSNHHAVLEHLTVLKHPTSHVGNGTHVGFQGHHGVEAPVSKPGLLARE